MAYEKNKIAAMNGDIALVTNGELAALLPHIDAATREAGALIMRFYEAARKGGPAAMGAVTKTDGTPVTQADRESSIFIETRLAQLTPGIAVVSEENGVCPADGAGLYWTVDPLDGTKEFMNRTDGFAVNIALVDHGTPVLGVVYAPVFNDMYHGLRDGTATRQTGQNNPRPLSVRDTGGYDLRVLFNAAHADRKLYDAQRKAFAPTGVLLPEDPDGHPNLPRNLRVAEGLADINVMTGRNLETGGGHMWDNAADWLILTNAGGEMRRLPDGAPLTFVGPRQKMPAYISIGDKKLGKKLFPEI